MNRFIQSDVLDFLNGAPRVCVPYGIELFDLARWVIFEEGANVYFRINSGNEEEILEVNNIVDFFIKINNKCVSYKLSNSYITSLGSGAVYYFDMHERFSFFSGSIDVIRYIFPFPYEVMWENFALSQGEDADSSLKEVFKIIHSA